MENQKSSNGTIIGVFIGFGVALIIVVGLFFAKIIVFNSQKNDITNKDDTIINNTNKDNANVIHNDNNLYTYRTINGLYKYVGKTIKDDDTNTVQTPIFQLYLYENGTFLYDLSTAFNPNIMLGNYIIDNNNINLNAIFRQGSGIGVTPLNENYSLQLNSNNSIIGVESPISEINSSDIKLVKSSTEEEKQFLQSHDFSTMINSAFKALNG